MCWQRWNVQTRTLSVCVRYSLSIRMDVQMYFCLNVFHMCKWMFLCSNGTNSHSRIHFRRWELKILGDLWNKSKKILIGEKNFEKKIFSTELSFQCRLRKYKRFCVYVKFFYFWDLEKFWLIWDLCFFFSRYLRKFKRLSWPKVVWAKQRSPTLPQCSRPVY